MTVEKLKPKQSRDYHRQSLKTTLIPRHKIFLYSNLLNTRSYRQCAGDKFNSFVQTTTIVMILAACFGLKFCPSRLRKMNQDISTVPGSLSK